MVWMQMLTDQLAKIHCLLQDLEKAIDEIDVDKAKGIISSFQTEIERVFETPSELKKNQYQSIQDCLDGFDGLISKVNKSKKNTGNELGGILNVKKKLKAYKNAK